MASLLQSVVQKVLAHVRAQVPVRVQTALVVAVLLGGAVSACADQTGPATAEVRLLVQTSPADRAADSATLTAQVSAATKIPAENVEYVASGGGDWHAIVVRCTNTARCDEVVPLLRADATHFAAVQLDDRRSAIPRSKAQ